MGETFYITLRIAAKTFHYFNATMIFRKWMQNKTKWLHIFFWNFHHVYLTGKRTALSISWATIVLWYLDNWGESYWLIEWTYFLYCCCLIFFLWKFCWRMTVSVVWQSINDYVLLVPSNWVIDGEYLKKIIASRGVVYI